MKSHTGFRLVSESMTLNDLESRNDLRCGDCVDVLHMNKGTELSNNSLYAKTTCHSKFKFGVKVPCECESV